MAQRSTVDSMGDLIIAFTAHELLRMMTLTATRAAATDVVAAVWSTIPQQYLQSGLRNPRWNDLPQWLPLFRNARSGNAVIAAAPQLQTSFGLLATPEVHLNPQERRLGEEHIAEATRPV